jgi:hypothetical protein
MDAVVARSRAMMEPLVALDRAVADALEARSLAALSGAYEKLRAHAEAIEAHMEAGEHACGCDVALTNLLVIVGFAVNKLDGEGRYQDWMRDESLNLLASYRDMASDCAADTGRAKFASRLTAHHIETL